MANTNHILKQIQAALAESGMSMRQASIAAGLSQSYLHGILKGGKEPTITKLMAIALVLNVPVSSLIGESKNERIAS